jgi:hypothetical protein
MIDHTPLDVGRLSPAAQKALGPGPARMMAARGMAPLPPGDQIVVLYQLSLDGDAKIAASAKATAADLPEKLLAGALGSANVDPRVLDMFAPMVAGKPAAFEALVGNAAVADDTIAVLAAKAGEEEIDRIAGNEQRLLRHPAIISAMYLNKHARMSTVDRAIELAVRNNVRVPNLMAWDEIARSLQGAAPASAEEDALFAEVAAGADDERAGEAPAEEPQEETEELPFDKLSIPAKIRAATIGDSATRTKAIRSPIKMVALAAIKSPAVSELEARTYASNHTLAEEVIRHIASRRDWIKNYDVKLALCRNPKTPVVEAMKLMPGLREKDLTMVSTSRGIPAAVVSQARKLLMQRRGGGDKK